MSEVSQPLLQNIWDMEFAERCTDPAPQGCFHAKVNVQSILVHIRPSDVRHVRHWVPLKGKNVIGTIVLLHGYGESTNRHHHFAKVFCDQGFQVLGMDHKYHGSNASNHGYCITDMTSFDELVDDAIEFIKVVEPLPLPYFIFGHSMGGLIAVRAALRCQSSWKCRGLILSGPAIRIFGNWLAPKPYCCLFYQLATLISCCMPCLPSPGARDRDLTSNTQSLEELTRDPQLFGSQVSARFGQRLVVASKETQEQLGDIACPFYILHGDKDVVSDKAGSQRLYKEAVSSDKKIHIISDALHEVLHEDERDGLLLDILQWVQQRMPTESTAI